MGDDTSGPSEREPVQSNLAVVGDREDGTNVVADPGSSGTPRADVDRWRTQDLIPMRREVVRSGGPGSSFAETVTRLRIGPQGRSAPTRISIVTTALAPASKADRTQMIVNAARPSVEPTAEQLPPSIFGRRLMGSTPDGSRSVTTTWCAAPAPALVTVSEYLTA